MVLISIDVFIPGIKIGIYLETVNAVCMIRFMYLLIQHRLHVMNSRPCQLSAA